MPQLRSTVLRSLPGLVLATLVAACIQVGTGPGGKAGKSAAANADLNPRSHDLPAGAPCIEGGQPAYEGATKPRYPERYDKNCCSEKVDESGVCTDWPGRTCASNDDCHRSEVPASMRTTCDGGHCCLAFGEVCDNGTCCDGMDCIPRQGKPMYARSTCGQKAPKQLGEACKHHFECQSQICRKGKCFSACVTEKDKCGSAQDLVEGRTCCEPGLKCSKLDKTTKQWTPVKPPETGICPAVLHAAGCTQAGIQCDPTAKGGPGSVMNNCCGYCGADFHCHDKK